MARNVQWSFNFCRKYVYKLAEEDTKVAINECDETNKTYKDRSLLSLTTKYTNACTYASTHAHEHNNDVLMK